MARRGILWTLAAVLAVGCSDANLAEPEGLGLEAAGYLNLALDVMQAYSLRRYEIDWVAFREAAIADAGNAKTPSDTYDAIRAALVRIGDNHSFFRPPGAVPAAAPPPVAAPPLLADPRSELIAPDVGYLEVTAFSGGGPEGDELATRYHELIEGVDTLGVCGWVVDLRGNTGGNMWPMLAGIGPIVGGSRPGSFVDPDSVVNEWFYDGGTAGVGESVLASAEPFYQARDTFPPVAVLTDAETASSGEAVAVAFRGRTRARSFGSASFGVPTANAGFGMPDGAMIFLTVAWTADRTGEIYDAPLEPDALVAGAKTGDPATDAVLAAALDWLDVSYCGS